MEKIIIVFILVSFTSCTRSNTREFSPVVGGKCLDYDSKVFWRNSDPGDQGPAPNPIYALSETIVAMLTVIPMYFLDVGHLGTEATKLIVGSMPQCGNWCGSGFPPATENPPAVDLLDTACMRHDLCYRANGDYNCKCDQQLAYEVIRARHLSEMPALEKKIAVYFRASHCENGCKQIAGTNNCSNRYKR